MPMMPKSAAAAAARLPQYATEAVRDRSSDMVLPCYMFKQREHTPVSAFRQRELVSRHQFFFGFQSFQSKVEGRSGPPGPSHEETGEHE